MTTLGKMTNCPTGMNVTSTAVDVTGLQIPRSGGDEAPRVIILDRAFVL